MAKKQPRYVVHCGDAHLYFAFGHLYRLTQLEEVFKRKVQPLQEEFFPGLVLKDAKGNLWRPELQVHFVPVLEPEEK